MMWCSTSNRHCHWVICFASRRFTFLACNSWIFRTYKALHFRTVFSDISNVLIFCWICLEEPKGQKKVQRIGVTFDSTLLVRCRLQINPDILTTSNRFGSVQSLKALHIRLFHASPNAWTLLVQAQGPWTPCQLCERPWLEIVWREIKTCLFRFFCIQIFTGIPVTLLWHSSTWSGFKSADYWQESLTAIIIVTLY